MTGRSIAILGLGNMGAALAAALKSCGHQVTGWNRTGKPQHRDLGISLVSDPIDAINSAEVTIVCLSSYRVTQALMDAPVVTDALKRKTLVQLSSGLPAEAKAMAAWAGSLGIRYLDGKVAVIPQSVGREATVIFYAGKAQVFEDQKPMLLALGGRPTFVGEAPEAASLADFAFLCFFFHSTIGMLYGAAFAEAAGLDVQQYLSNIPSFQQDIGGRVPAFQAAMAAGDFKTKVQSSLAVDLNGAELLVSAAAGISLSSEPATFIAETFRRGVKAGMQGMDTGALMKLFQERA